MNPKQLEPLLLLESSGELSPKQRCILDTALAASPEARRFREQLRTLTAAIRPPVAMPAPETAASIDARLQQKSKSAFILLPAWKPALAAVATLALLLGVRTVHRARPSLSTETTAAASVETEEWTDPFDAEFAELESLLFAIASDDSLEITEL